MSGHSQERFEEEIDLDEQAILNNKRGGNNNDKGSRDGGLGDEEENDSDIEQDAATQQGWLDILEKSKNDSVFEYTKRVQHIPKRGEKDYEPDGTDVQQMLLFKSREAMFDTITYSARGTILKQLIKAYYVPSMHKAVIFHPKGPLFSSIGQSDKNSYLWLNIHEFVYMVERGSITPFICFSEDMTSEEGLRNVYTRTKKSDNVIDDDEDEVMLSLDQVYQFFESKNELNEFKAYAYLKRLGYIVWKTGDRNSSFFNDSHIVTECQTSKYATLFSSWCPLFIRSLPAVLFGKYLNTNDIYTSLQKNIAQPMRVPKNGKDLFQMHSYYDKLLTEDHQNYKISFDIWKPETNFKKKNPSLPNFQVVIYDKNDQNIKFPNKSDFQHIFNQLDHKFQFLDNITDWDEHTYINGVSRKEVLLSSSKKKKTVIVEKTKNGVDTKGNKNNKDIKLVKESMEYQKMHAMKKLKKGYRSFILAVIDDGLVSFLEISEADFANENVFYVPPKNKNNSSPTQKRNNKKKNINIHSKHST